MDNYPEVSIEIKNEIRSFLNKHKVWSYEAIFRPWRMKLKLKKTPFHHLDRII
jgi:hypothetical protein